MPSPKTRSWTTRLLLAFSAGAALLWGFTALPVVAWVSAAQEHIGAMGAWGALLYPVLFALCNIFIIPGGSVVAVGAGLFFGIWLGAFQLLLGSVLAAGVAFGVARRLGRQRLERHLLARPLWSRLDRAIEQEGWKIVFLSQLHPFFPTSILNYFYGITRIRFWPCLFWVAAGQLPSCFLYAYLGTIAHVGVKAAKGEHDLHALDYAIWAGGGLLSIALFVVLGRLALRLMGEIREEEGSVAVKGNALQESSGSAILPLRSDNTTGAS